MKRIVFIAFMKVVVDSVSKEVIVECNVTYPVCSCVVYLVRLFILCLFVLYRIFMVLCFSLCVNVCIISDVLSLRTRLLLF